MKQAKYPSAEIRCDGNLFAIENFTFFPEEKKQGNPYNTTFGVRIVSGVFSGYAFCEYDLTEFIRFTREMGELFSFHRNKAELNDICYGSKVVFCMDRTGHLDISGKIFGHAAEHCLNFRFAADQTCLNAFIQTVNAWIMETGDSAPGFMDCRTN